MMGFGPRHTRLVVPAASALLLGLASLAAVGQDRGDAASQGTMRLPPLGTAADRGVHRGV